MASEHAAPPADPPLRAGERLLAPTRRPDGTMRKPIRIRAGYTPQDEVAIYQSKGALFRKGAPQVPPGYDPIQDVPQKPKTKAAKKNERRKEKKHQEATASSLANGETPHSPSLHQNINTEVPGGREDIEAVAQQISSLSVSNITPDKEPEKASSLEKADLDKRIRALRKKIRLTESLQTALTSTGTATAEQAERLSRLEIWHKELNDLEAQRGSF